MPNSVSSRTLKLWLTLWFWARTSGRTTVRPTSWRRYSVNCDLSSQILGENSSQVLPRSSLSKWAEEEGSRIERTMQLANVYVGSILPGEQEVTSKSEHLKFKTLEKAEKQTSKLVWNKRVTGEVVKQRFGVADRSLWWLLWFIKFSR